MNIPMLIGRILFGGYFLVSGIHHFQHLGMMTGYAGSKGVPSPKLAVIVSGLLLVLGGAGVLLWWNVQMALVCIIAFLVPVTFMMHAYWKTKDPAAQSSDRIQFMKNMGLVGAALLLWSVM